MEETNNNGEKRYTDPVTGRFIPGNPGGGRPKGAFSIKDMVRQFLQEHPEDLDKFVQHFAKKNKELTWMMLEGRPRQNVGLDGGEEDKPIPILHVLHNLSDPQNTSTEEKDQGDTGGNISE